MRYLCAGNAVADVFLCRVKGNCVVAREAIKRGQLVSECPVSVVESKDIRKNCAFDQYPIWWRGRKDCIAFGLINLINHSSAPNVRLCRDYKRMTIRCYAKRNILRGEELAYDYACKLWFREAGEVQGE